MLCLYSFLFPMGLDVMLVVVIQLVLVYILSLLKPGLYFYPQETPSTHRKTTLPITTVRPFSGFWLSNCVLGKMRAF